MSADDALKCYTYRHVDLLGGYCHDNVLACDWNALRVHKQEHAVQEGRKVACRNHDTQCYAYRYTELLDSLCSGDINSCNWLGLVTHFAQKGRFEGKTMECETPETKCYLQRNPDLAAEFCGQEGDDTCEWPSIVESLMKNAESEGRPTGCLPPSPPPSPTPPHHHLRRLRARGLLRLRRSWSLARTARRSLVSILLLLRHRSAGRWSSSRLASRPLQSSSIASVASTQASHNRASPVPQTPKAHARASYTAHARAFLLTRTYASPSAVIVRENEVVTAADDIEGDSQVMNDWDDDYDDDYDRPFSGGKKKKKGKKGKKHQIADYD